MSEFPQIEGYKIVKALPAGGWAEVYVARGRHGEVALKVLKDRLASQEEKVKEFFLEAKLVSRFNSPNIVKVKEIGPETSRPYYFTMEYYPCGNLNTFLKEKKILTSKEIVYVASEICRALKAIHAEGYLHLDLKPANILFGKNNQIVLSDFGISKKFGELTPEDHIQGTPQYMSPEQFSGSVSIASDLYSLGIIMYMSASGQLPFDSTDYTQLGLLHNKAVPLPIHEYNPIFNRDLEKVIFRLLEKKPENRYTNADELLSVLSAFEPKEDKRDYNVVLTQLDENGNILKRKSYSSFPIIFTKNSDSSNNFPLYDSFASREHATILNPEPGKFLISDHSKNGTKVGGTLLNNTSTVIDIESAVVEVGKTRVLVSTEKRKIPRLSISAVKPVYFLLSAMLMFILLAGYLIWPKSESPVSISDLTGIEETVTTGKPFTFSFTLGSDPEIPVNKIIIAPMGRNNQKIITLPVETREYTYEDVDLGDKDSDMLPFEIKVIDIKGNESNWLTQNIKVVKEQYEIELAGLDLPSEATVSRPVPFSFGMLSKYPNSEIEIITADNNIQSAPVAYTAMRGKGTYTFRSTGTHTFTLVARNAREGKVSNVLRRQINITEEILPEIRFVRQPSIYGRVVRIAFDYNDKRYRNPADFSIYALTDGRRILLDPDTRQGTLTFDQSGSYSIALQVITRDQRKNTCSPINVQIN